MSLSSFSIFSRVSGESPWSLSGKSFSRMSGRSVHFQNAFSRSSSVLSFSRASQSRSMERRSEKRSPRRSRESWESGLGILFLGDHGLGRSGQMNGDPAGEFGGQGTGQVFVAEGIL